MPVYFLCPILKRVSYFLSVLAGDPDLFLMFNAFDVVSNHINSGAG